MELRFPHEDLQRYAYRESAGYTPFSREGSEIDSAKGKRFHVKISEIFPLLKINSERLK